MDILFAITTGRADFKGTLDMMAENFDYFGHFEGNRIGLAVNYDCSFLGLQDEDFVYKTGYSRLFQEVLYIGQKHVKEYVDLMTKCGIGYGLAQTLSQATGYSNKKNLVYMEAIKRGYDVVLFWDDDEYPLACSLSDDLISWLQTDILGAHISAYTDFAADVAFGFFTGYASPVPLNLDQRFSGSTAYRLGDALSVASDVVDANTFIKTDQIFKGLDGGCLKFKEIEPIDGGKWISGGNLSVRVDAVRKAVVPPFYAPPSTRADDTILSMGLDNAKVIQVPAVIFHDAFGEYRSLKSKSYPGKLIRNSDVDTHQVERFCGALKGWLGYAPIMLRIRHGESFYSHIEKMMDRLELLDADLFRDLPEARKMFDGASSSDILRRFSENVETDFRTMRECYGAWEIFSRAKSI